MLLMEPMGDAEWPAVLAPDSATRWNKLLSADNRGLANGWMLSADNILAARLSSAAIRREHPSS